MTPEQQQQQRITIAEACGWVPCTPSDLTLSERLTYGDRWWRHPEDKTIACLANLPDYPNDLNACAEFEKVLTEEQKWRMIGYIVDYHVAPAGFPLLSRRESILLLNATAAQRCEAFRRTLNI